MNKQNSLIDSILDYLMSAKDRQQEWIKDPTRCVWLDNIILGLVNVIAHLRTCEPFYHGKKGLEPDRLVSHYIETTLIPLVKLHLRGDLSAMTEFPNDDQLEMFQMASLILEDQLNEVMGAAHPHLSLSTDLLVTSLKNCRTNKSVEYGLLVLAARGYYLALGERAFLLKIREHQIWLDHPRWKIAGYEGDPNGPYDCRELMNNLAQALVDFGCKNQEIFFDLNALDERMDRFSESHPAVFTVRRNETGTVESFEYLVRSVLLVRPQVSCANPVMSALNGRDEIEWFEPSAVLAEERIRLVNDLIGYFQHRADAASASPVVRRKWLEAEAEMLADVSGFYDAARVDRIIALANEAQRESWIEAKMKKGGPSATESVTVDLNPVLSTVRESLAQTEKITLEMMEQFMKKHMKGPNATAEKPQRLGTRRADPLMGPRTVAMNRQLKRFADYIDNGHPVNDGPREHSVGTRADQFWKANKSDFETAAKRADQEKGYGSAKALADAYRQWLRQKTAASEE